MSVLSVLDQLERSINQEVWEFTVVLFGSCAILSVKISISKLKRGDRLVIQQIKYAKSAKTGFITTFTNSESVFN